MEFRKGSLLFPETRGEGPQTVTQSVRFPRRVARAVVGIASYSVEFGDRSDRNLGRIHIQVEAHIDAADPQNVEVRGTLGLRDWSGSWDDSYQGTIEHVLLAELDAATAPPPGGSRPDLIVTGLEITQAIQHFRSHLHLDPANQFPDNSVRLVAGKSTVIRAYVDYDASSGLPPIATLSGELEVRRRDQTIARIGPENSIVPRRDAQINRGSLGHTLNFVIGGGLCEGTRELRVRVFDRVNPAAFAEQFQHTVLFEELPALRIFRVRINYTGPDRLPDATDEDVAAPPVQVIATDLLWLLRVYPTSTLSLTGQQDMEYDKEIKSDISKGCDKFGTLLDALEDLRGDATEALVGFLNVGVDTGSVGGCGRHSGRVAVCVIGSGSRVAHEVGHALKRNHAPCDNITRCSRPHNVDRDYPVYQGFDSDSIGEFGLDVWDPSSLKRPGTHHDFMSYSGRRWVSPYTYKALMSRLPEMFDDAAGAAAFAAGARRSSERDRESRDHGEWRPQKSEMLFVKLTVDADQSVDLQEAFHYPAWPHPPDDQKTEFVLELLDDEGHRLVQQCLYAHTRGCGCGEDHGWPVHISQTVSYPTGASTLLIRDSDRILLERRIPNPPRVQMRVMNATDQQATAFDVVWETDAEPPIWYLVHWRDRTGVWRGAGVRTQDTSMKIPKSWFRGQKRAAIRVLATSGIATGTATWDGPLDVSNPSSREETYAIVELPGVNRSIPGTYALPRMVHPVVTDRYGITIPRPELRWHVIGAGEIGRGPVLDLRKLPRAKSVLRCVVLDTGGGGGTHEWHVERTRAGRFVARVPQRRPPSSP